MKQQNIFVQGCKMAHTQNLYDDDKVLGIESCTKIKECLDWLMKFAFTNPTSSKEIFLKKN